MTKLPHNLPLFVQHARPFVNHYGYFAVVALLLLESLGLPVPGETTLIVASLFAIIGKLNIFVVVILAIAATVLGDNIGYLIGWAGGRRLIVRYGKYVFITKSRLEKLEKFFDKQGPKIIVVSRFIDGLRQLNGIIAGASSMTWRKFLRYNIIGAVLWVATWTSVGYFGASHINVVEKYQLSLTILASIVFGLYVIFLVVRSHSERTKKA